MHLTRTAYLSKSFQDEELKISQVFAAFFRINNPVQTGATEVMKAIPFGMILGY
jgi:hypothetical protein